MSTHTKAALEDAIRAHLDDETDSGPMLVAWELVTARVDAESYHAGGAHYWREMPDGQPLHVSEGLLRCGLRMIGDTWSEGEGE